MYVCTEGSVQSGVLQILDEKNSIN